jgi:GGDEF domain-containing protein
MSTPKRMKLQIKLVIHEVLCDHPTGRRLPCLRADLALYQAKRNGRNRVEETVATAGEAVGRA